jgi:trans-2,3-dihydro-3-hydroxyanthranilate isomerase
MAARLVQVDVFAQARLGGNPLAVFVNPPDLPTERLQAWAREMNLSETTFAWVTAPDRYRVRIFTPERELPFAGHPTLGTAAVLHAMGLVGERVTQESASGETVCWRDRHDVWWMAPRLGSVSPPLPPAVGAAALGVAEEWVSADRPPQVVEAGLPHLLVNVAAGVIGSLDPPFAEMRRLLNNLPERPAGLLVWAPAGASQIRARCFAPAAGVNEDPATGSAAADLGWYLVRVTGVTDPVIYHIHQGIEIGRPSELLLGLNLDADQRVWVGGHVVPVFEADVETL